MPAKFSGIKVPLLNADKRSQVIRKGIELGVFHEAQVMDEVTEVTEEVKKKEELIPPEAVAIEKIIKQLPDEVTGEQREKVKSLLKEYSTGEHDIGRTNLIEHRIDTGGYRPIRQPFRRHPFQHLEFIDNKVKEMEKHGIVDPADSPWASNVVLVKKKDGSLRFSVDYRRPPVNKDKSSEMLPLHWIKRNEVSDESITSASAISTPLNSENEVKI